MYPETEAALLGAVAGAVLGVLGTYVFDVRRTIRERADRDATARRERAEHKATVATALLEDLRTIEYSFRQVYDMDTPTKALIVRPSQFFDALKAETRWFRADSIYPVAETFRLADQFHDSLAGLRRSGGGLIRSTAEREHELKVQAGFILQTIPAARDALIREGAILEDPDPNFERVTFPSLPRLPDPVFRKTRERLAIRERERRDLNSRGDR